jgi:integrase
MARTARNAKLDSRKARLSLDPRGKPYWTATGKKGVLLGYRRLANRNGTWAIKRYLGRDEDIGGRYTTESLEAEADDYASADGAAVLDYYQAIATAIQRAGLELTDEQRSRRYTVADAIADYVSYLKKHRKSGRGAQLRLNAYVLPFLGEKLLADLKDTDFERWLDWAEGHTPKGRRRDKPRKSKKETKTDRPVIDAATRKRRKRANINRVINDLKACMNRALDKKPKPVQNDDAWRKLKKFKGADASRPRWLIADQAARLINAAAPDFKPIIHAAMLTGCRWSELRALKSGEYDRISGTVNIGESKSGKPRTVFLSDAGKLAFDSWTADRPENSLIFTNGSGAAWGSHDQIRRIAAACVAADINPPVGFHALRHSYASQLVQVGVPLAYVAEALGHADTRMVSKHYGHIAPSHLAETIRARLPTLDVQP